MPDLKLIAGRALDEAAKGPTEREEWEDEERGGTVLVGRLFLGMILFAAAVALASALTR